MPSTWKSALASDLASDPASDPDSDPDSNSGVAARFVVPGHWYPALSSERCAAILTLEGQRFSLERLAAADDPNAAMDEGANAVTNAEAGIVLAGDTDTLDISNRLGATARRITLDDGSLFETGDNTSIDAWLGTSDHAAGRSVGIHRLESSGRMIVLGVLVTVGVVFAAFRWGLPAGAEYLSNRLPVAAHETIGNGTLATMDRLFLEESELDDDSKAEIRTRFESMVAALPDQGFTLTLHFRKLADVPNAFALPGGDVVVTDALVDLVEEPEELDSVLLHEIGHVHERHGMQQAIQASAITLILALSIGDVGVLGDVAAGIPVFLVQSNYSRRAETEADEFAFAGMAATGRDPKHFATIIRRLSESGRARPTDETEAGEKEAGERSAQSRDEADASDESASDWFSSHPDAERRAARALEVSREMADGRYQPSFPEP